MVFLLVLNILQVFFFLPMNNLDIIGLIDLENTPFLRESPTVGYLSFLCGFVVVIFCISFIFYILAVSVLFGLSE